MVFSFWCQNIICTSLCLHILKGRAAASGAGRGPGGERPAGRVGLWAGGPEKVSLPGSRPVSSPGLDRMSLFSTDQVPGGRHPPALL